MASPRPSTLLTLTLNVGDTFSTIADATYKELRGAIVHVATAPATGLQYEASHDGVLWFVVGGFPGQDLNSSFWSSFSTNTNMVFPPDVFIRLHSVLGPATAATVVDLVAV